MDSANPLNVERIVFTPSLNGRNDTCTSHLPPRPDALDATPEVCSQPRPLSAKTIVSNGSDDTSLTMNGIMDEIIYCHHPCLSNLSNEEQDTASSALLQSMDFDEQSSVQHGTADSVTEWLSAFLDADREEKDLNAPTDSTEVQNTE